MDIGPADADCFDADQNGFRAEFRLASLLNLDPTRTQID